MKIALVFILFLTLISCNNHQTTNVTSHLEDSTPSHSDNIQSTKIPIPNKKQITASEISKSVMHVNNIVIGVYTGTIDDKYFKLCIDKAFGDEAEGYIVSGNEKKLVKGKVIKYGVEPSPKGDLTIYRLILSEKDKTKGEYLIYLSLGGNIASGGGNWVSHNKKQQSNIKINVRTL